jgi:hypothetical protein
MNAAKMLVRALRDPLWAERLSGEQWTGLITAARAESLVGALAYRLSGARLPDKVAAILDDARHDSRQAQAAALWEAEMARRALAPLSIQPILLKGTAYAAAGLWASAGRSIGDLDILVARERLGAVQQALIGAGWEWVKEDAYDDQYYRRWMHELPPLIHKQRDRMIDVHHTILPLTARRRPDAGALIADSVAVGEGLRMLSQPDMVIHAAAHLFADGDLAGGLRNLWDIDRMLREFSVRPGFWRDLERRSRLHQLSSAVARSLRLAASLYGTPVDEACAGAARPSDILFRRRLLARNGWGQEVRPLLRFAFYLRSHLLRMPPLMLARHLSIKAWRGRGTRPAAVTG